MIEKMRKVYCVARERDRDALLEAIRGLGVLHLVPVGRARAVADEKISAEIARLDRALQVLSAAEASGEAPGMGPREAAAEVLKIERANAERRSRLTALYRRLREIAPWGDVRLDDLASLREAGVDVKFYRVPAGEVGAIEAECIEVVGSGAARQAVVAVVDRTGGGRLPEGAEELAIPKADAPSIRAEAAGIDAAMREDAAGLGRLAALREAMEKERAALDERAAFSVAARGALAGEELFAVQGWIPAKRAGALAEGLARAGVEAAVETFEPGENEEPPTLIGYPSWVRPIKGLFDILGTVPGYREIDVSAFFMVALPLFAAIIIGDGGYGLVFLLAGIVFYRKGAAAAGAAKMQLLIVTGLITFLWGILTGGFFGLAPLDLAKAGGALERIGYAWNRVTFVGASTAEIADAVAGGETARLKALADLYMLDLRITLMKVSFILAVAHLVLARLREAVGLAPAQRALASVGWATVLVGVFGVIWYLFFGMPEGAALSAVWPILAACGWVVAALFSAPYRNPVKRLGLGIASCLLPTMDTFSNTMSYIRLMAVSMASVYIAQVFNMLGAQLAGVATWAAGAPVVLFGHALNIGLCMIAIFAHGVRLNMLEFSSNAGVQWGGYAYAPFGKTTLKES